jgi:hypothetical protein
MLEVIEPIKLEHTLSQRTLDIIMRHVGMSVYDLLSPGVDWILGEKWISKEGQSYLDTILRPLGYRLQREKPERNALIAYERVSLHNDAKLELKHSTVFIPVKTPPGTRFLHFDRNTQAHIIPLDVGSILLFDQNHDHKLVFPRDEDGEEDASLKIGIALCLDKISP